MRYDEPLSPPFVNDNRLTSAIRNCEAIARLADAMRTLAVDKDEHVYFQEPREKK